MFWVMGAIAFLVCGLWSAIAFLALWFECDRISDVWFESDRFLDVVGYGVRLYLVGQSR